MFLKSLFLLITFCGTIYSQFLVEEIYRATSTETNITEILDISITGSAIIRVIEEKISNYYLVDLFNVLPQKLIFTSSPSRGNAIWFSENNRFIVFNPLGGDEIVVKIYDTFDGTIWEINDPHGEVIYASVLSENQILYEVRPPRDYAKIYLVNEDFSNPKCIGDGFTPLWSPNGKWFLTRKSDYDKDNLNDERGKLFGYRITTKPIYSIYKTDGQRILDIPNHEDIHYIKWAPTSDKIVLQEFSDGFYIVHLKTINDQLIIENEFHFEGFAKEGENVASAENPNWSPDGDWISFIKSVEDGHRILGSSVYIYNIKSHEQYEIIKYNDRVIQKIIWLSNEQLLALLVDSDNYNEKFIYKIDVGILTK